MKKTVVAVLIALASLSALSIAQEYRGEGLALPNGTPEEYTVREGDTLWGISEQFLGDPWQWPALWKKNEFIDDQHDLHGESLGRDKDAQWDVKTDPQTGEAYPKPDPWINE